MNVAENIVIETNALLHVTLSRRTLDPARFILRGIIALLRVERRFLYLA